MSAPDPRPGFYDRQGRPVDELAYARLHADPDYVILARTGRAGWLVSTVWLGFDHNFGGDGPPVIFETMVFPPDSSEDAYCERYATETAALAGHDRAAAWLRDRLAGQERP